MTQVVKVSTGFPDHYYSQEELVEMLCELWAGDEDFQRRVDRLHRNMKIRGRYLTLPINQYSCLSGLSKSSQLYQANALEMGQKVLWPILNGPIDPDGIAMLLFTTVTGLSVPSIDARLMNLIPFSPYLKRVPLFGLGCLGGAAGLARTMDYLDGHPNEAAILLSIELCSLTMQKDDLTVANLVSSGLFGDGAAAVLLVGQDHPLARPGQPRLIGSRSVFFPQTEEIMGYEIRDTGFKMILGANVHRLIVDGLKPAIVSFLEEFGLQLADIEHWLVHPGGPKILEAVEETLELGSGELGLSWSSLAEVGNLSSASVLMILDQFLASCKPQAGSYGLMLAFGPAFCAELVLFQW